MRRHHPLWICLAASVAAMLPLVTGCSLTSTAPSETAMADVSEIHLQGMVHGGQQALGHALIQLYAMGTGTVPGAAGYAAKATPLIASPIYTSTDGSGGFTITGTYSCPTGAQVYLTAAGGTIDGTTTNSNPNITLMAALGSCSSLLSNASTAFIIVNEVSTVAAAYALAQFAATSTFGTALSAQPGSATVAPADNIATSSSNAQGLINAIATSAVLANSYSPTGTPTGTSPGNNTNGTASVEYWTVNTVANILAGCVNSAALTLATAGDGTMCGNLYQYTTPAGKTAPRDTFQAALYMALYPGDTNLLSGTYPGSNLTNLISATPPFMPYVVPDGTKNLINDWTIGISYSPVVPSTTTKLIYFPYTLAVDSVGNIWSYNISSAKPSYVAETDPTGNPVLAGTHSRFHHLRHHPLHHGGLRNQFLSEVWRNGLDHHGPADHHQQLQSRNRSIEQRLDRRSDGQVCVLCCRFRHGVDRKWRLSERRGGRVLHHHWLTGCGGCRRLRYAVVHGQRDKQCVMHIADRYGRIVQSRLNSRSEHVDRKGWHVDLWRPRRNFRVVHCHRRRQSILHRFHHFALQRYHLRQAERLFDRPLRFTLCLGSIQHGAGRSATQHSQSINRWALSDHIARLRIAPRPDRRYGLIRRAEYSNSQHQPLRHRRNRLHGTGPRHLLRGKQHHVVCEQQLH